MALKVTCKLWTPESVFRCPRLAPALQAVEQDMWALTWTHAHLSKQELLGVPSHAKSHSFCGMTLLSPWEQVIKGRILDSSFSSPSHSVVY